MKWNRAGGSSGKGSPRNDLADDHQRDFFPSKSMPSLQFSGYHDPNTPILSIPVLPISSLHPSELFNSTSAPAVEHLGSSSSSTSYNSGFFVDGLPPRMDHRHRRSEIPSGSAMSSLPPLSQSGYLNFSNLSSYSSNGSSFGSENKYHNQLAKQEMSDIDAGDRFRSIEAFNVDDLVNSYMNLDGLEEEEKKMKMKMKITLADEDNQNETNSGVKYSGSNGTIIEIKKQEGFNDDMNISSIPFNHSRSLSMDSFLDKMKKSVGESSSSMMVGIRPPPANFQDVIPVSGGFEFGNGDFSGGELKKIMANVRLSEIARTDPKRAKRILANRQSAARSKERKLKYMYELEHKVQTLQTEATALATRLTLLRRDSVGLTNQNNELRFRLLAMEQQAQIRDALNAALEMEVQQLKLLTLDFSHIHSSNYLNQQIIDQYLHQVEFQQHHQSSTLMFQSRNQQEEEKDEEEQWNGSLKQMNFVAPKDEFDSNFE